jgi:antitoxin component YwqK of YwqJK toxin-antitoxin module
MKKYKLTYLLTIILIGFSNCISAQNNAIIKYYDSLWMSTSKNAAFYFTEFIKEDTFYRCTSYWMKSKKLNCKSTYSDTLFSKPIGILLRYYENGQTEDSTFYENGTLKNTFHYYPNGNLWVHYSYNKESKEQITEAYDMDGNKLKDFIYLKEASFPGGQSAGELSCGKN